MTFPNAPFTGLAEVLGTMTPATKMAGTVILQIFGVQSFSFSTYSVNT